MNRYLEKVAFMNLGSIGKSIKNTVHVLKGGNIADATAAVGRTTEALNNAKATMNRRNKYLNQVLKSKGDLGTFKNAEKMYNSSMKRASGINRSHKQNLDALELAKKKTSKYRRNLTIGTVATGGVASYGIYSKSKTPSKFSVK